VGAVLFDRYVVVDWSASNRRRTGKDSIWIGVLGADGSVWTENPSTRGRAEAAIRHALRQFVASGERVLVGFDFPYGYPAGLAAALGLTGPPWRAVWQYLVDQIRDDVDTNRSNRFAVASDINALLGRHVFWGRPYSQHFADLSAKRDQVAYGTDGGSADIGEWRRVEAVLRARRHQPQSAWKLLGSGSVGSQTLTGLPVVSRLRHDGALAGVSAAWPFEVLVPELPAGCPAVVHVEIWPSLIPIPTVVGQVKDQTQVICLARELRDRDRHETIAALFAAPSPASTSQEGWILGVDD
jgi:precorrin-8X/cobalt-precorrin-8 methylmutase